MPIESTAGRAEVGLFLACDYFTFYYCVFEFRLSGTVLRISGVGYLSL